MNPPVSKHFVFLQLCFLATTTRAGLGSGSFSDTDCDGDVDVSDLGAFVTCFNGPGVPATAHCAAVFDADTNGAIELLDFGDLQRQFTGSLALTPFVGSCDSECPSYAEERWKLYQVSDPGGTEFPSCTPGQLGTDEIVCVVVEAGMADCPEISEATWFDESLRC